MDTKAVKTLYELRTKKGMTQSEVSDKAGFTFNKYGLFERGKLKLKPEELQTVFKVLEPDKIKNSQIKKGEDKMTTQVAVRDNKPSQTLTTTQHDEFSRERIDLWKRTFCKGATDDELALFVSVCRRTGLSPEARQVFAVKRWDAKLGREVMSIQISIDGFRVIAERSGKYAGQLKPMFCGADKKWTDVWLDSAPPLAAIIGVHRSDFKEPLCAVAVWKSYCQTDKHGSPTKMWKNMPEVMLAKCAEALALRKAFPNELSGLYTNDEMEQAANVVQVVATETNDSDQDKIIDLDSDHPTEAEILESEAEEKLSERAQKLLTAFEAKGVSKDFFEEYCDKKVVDFTDEDFAASAGIFKDVRSGKLTVATMKADIEVRKGKPDPIYVPVADPAKAHLESVFGSPSI